MAFSVPDLPCLWHGLEFGVVTSSWFLQPSTQLYLFNERSLDMFGKQAGKKLILHWWITFLYYVAIIKP